MTQEWDEDDDDLSNVTWERVIHEALKKPDDPIARMFLKIHVRLHKLEELCYRVYNGSDIYLNEEWVAEYKRLMETPYSD